MKINNLILCIGVCSALTFVSCKKEESTVNATETPSTETRIASFSSWSPITAGAASRNSGTIADAAITAEVANSGLVLLFSRSNSNSKASSFTASTNDAYYQVEEGNIVVNGAEQITDQQFRYVVLTTDQLKRLETKGYTPDQLISLSYDQATILFGN